MAHSDPGPAPEYDFPPTPGACLDRLAELRTALAALNLKVAPLAAEETALRDHLLGVMMTQGLNSVRGAGLAVARTETVVPNLADWDTFWAFAKRRGNEDLLQRAVSSPAWRARVEAGRDVPGVTAFKRVALRVSAARGE